MDRLGSIERLSPAPGIIAASGLGWTAAWLRLPWLWSDAGAAIESFLALVTLGFVVPIAMAALFVFVFRPPAVVVHESALCVRHPVFPWVTARVDYPMIRWLWTNAQAGGTGHAELIIGLTEAAYRQLSESRVWSRRDPVKHILHFSLGRVSVPPLQLVEHVNELVARTKSDTPPAAATMTGFESST